MMESETTRDARGRKRLIPEPFEPPFPIPSLKGLLARGGKAPSILDHGNAIEVTAGRYAIGLALRLLGVGPGDEVLAPAYHCTVMIDPIVAAGATPVFYKIGRDLNVDLDDTATKITPGTKALLASHLFGFPQNGPALRTFADQHGLALIEDCAHAFFGDGMGSYGDFVIGSSRKFFPIAEGGCLISKRPELHDIKLESQGLKDNISEVVMLVDRSLRYGRLSLLDLPLRALEALRGSGKASPDPEEGNTEPARPEEGSADYDPVAEDIAISGISRLLRRMTSTGHAARKRRENYEMLLDLVGDVPGVRAFFPQIAPGVVPFMAPFWVDRLEELFPLMEDAALPMQRYGQFLWQGVDENVCPVSIEMSRRMVQFSCHQDLTPAEIRRIAGAFREIALREN